MVDNPAQGEVAQSRALRLVLALLVMIPHERKVTVAELEQSLKNMGNTVSVRSIQRIMKKLVDECGLECDMSAKPFGYSWSKHQQVWKSRLLSPMDQLLLGLVYMRPGMYGNLPDHSVWNGRLRVVEPESVVAVPEMDKPLLALLCEAIVDQQQLQLNFECSKGVCELPVAHPLGMIFFAGIWFLLVLDSVERQLVPLALHKIFKAQWLNQSFKCDPAFDLNQYDCSLLESHLQWIQYSVQVE